MPTFRDGSVNLAGIVNPGEYVDIVPPTPLITGTPTNIEGLVGVASWGPVGAQKKFSTPSDCAGIYGTPKVRTYDLPTHVWAAAQMGQAIAFCGVRVTDGTDTAATSTIQSTGGTATAKYTGSLGNQIALTFQPGALSGSFDAVVQFPARTPERFRNIVGALAKFTPTAGTGYTSVPTLSLPAPTAPGPNQGGIQATATASLAVIGTPTIGAAGTGYVVGDFVTFANGVTLKVATVSSGAVATWAAVSTMGCSAGSVVGNGVATPANPVAQVSTTGIGTGATATLSWGLGPATITEPGFGYSASTPTVTMTGGGAGTGGSYAAVASFWGALARVINSGSPQNSASNYIMFTPGALTAAPTPLNTANTFSGGTDGDTGVGSFAMLGSDTLPRKGMYALRNSGCDTFALCDVVDSTTWTTQSSFGQSETIMWLTATPIGDSIAGAVAERNTAGIDDFGGWIIEGDWPQFNDTQNGLTRFVSPTAFATGLCGNLSPEQSPINKPLTGVVATQTSLQGLITADADEQTAQTGGIDLIGRSEDLGEDYFTFLTGNNASSNTAECRVEYTRLTYFLARSLQSASARSIVGQLQSIQANDPTRTKAKMIVDSFLASLQNPSVGSNGYGLIDAFATVCDLTNNPPNPQAQGFLFLFAAVRYLNAVRFFVIKLQGGGNVTVTQQATAPTAAQFQ